MTGNKAIIGAGCAGLSLARYIADRGINPPPIITDKDPSKRHDHIWGFWQTNWLDEACQTAKGRWHKWQICDHNHSIIHESHNHAYHAVSASDWLSDCAEKLGKQGGTIQPSPLQEDEDTLYFDSRPPQLQSGTLLQHFIGQHIKTDKAVFASDTAILMDFRVDQSQGLHFIYLLPFSETEALVESTLFTSQICPDSYYKEAIKSYLSTYYNLDKFDIQHEEKGAIPLIDLTPAKSQFAENIIPIGAASGALRPSSGYGFATIQRQAKKIATLLLAGKNPRPAPPHRALDLWMDKVFLSVLEKHPQKSPDLFIKMARAMKGDDFAAFMSGIAGPKSYLKVILAMPKWIFIRTALSVIWSR